MRRAAAGAGTGGLFVRGIPEGHGYSDSVRAEVVELFGEKQSYRALGLLIFSSIFHSTRTVLHMRREGGDDLGGEPITKVVVDDPRREDPGPSVSELLSRPTAYGYWPAVRTKLNPLYGAPHPSGFELPEAVWSNEEEMWWPFHGPRSVLHGFGLAEGPAKIAALLLDIGLPASEQARFVLEGPAGYQSVTAHSAEIHLWIGGNRT